MRSSAAHIVLHHVHKAYQEGERKRTVLSDLNLTIQEGEFVVLLGRSGSGKSTLLNIISGIDVPDTGDVVLGGTNVTKLSERDRTLFRREHIGFVFQAFNLIPTLTVAENILLPLELNGRTSASEQKAALETLGHVGLADRANSFPDRLSGGEQQRVAIARALAHDPLLILADEPTGNLDFKTASHVLGLIDELVHQQGKTTLMVTHDHDLIRLADRVLTLQEGQLEEEGIGVEDA